MDDLPFAEGNLRDFRDLLQRRVEVCFRNRILRCARLNLNDEYRIDVLLVLIDAVELPVLALVHPLPRCRSKNRHRILLLGILRIRHDDAILQEP